MQTLSVTKTMRMSQRVPFAVWWLESEPEEHKVPQNPIELLQLKQIHFVFRVRRSDCLEQLCCEVRGIFAQFRIAVSEFWIKLSGGCYEGFELTSDFIPA